MNVVEYLHVIHCVCNHKRRLTQYFIVLLLQVDALLFLYLFEINENLHTHNQIHSYMSLFVNKCTFHIQVSAINDSAFSIAFKE